MSTVHSTVEHANIPYDGTKTMAAAIAASQKSSFGFWGAVAAPASTSTRYLAPGGGTVLSSTQGAHIVCPGDCTINAIYATHDTAIAGDGMAYTVQIDDVDVAVACTIATTETTANSTGLSVACAAGSKVSIKAVESGTTAQSAMNASVSLMVTWT